MDENLLDDFLVKLVMEGGRHAWAGDTPPFPMDTFDLHGSTNYRLSSSLHGRYDVVWLYQITLNDFPKENSWMIILDECIRLLGETGKLVLRVNHTRDVSIPSFKAFLGRHIGIECKTIYERDITSNPDVMVFSIRRKNYSSYLSSKWTFGILTLGNHVEYVCRFLESIRKYDRNNEHQILIYGPADDAYQSYHVEYIEDEEGLMKSEFPEIGKKKNCIIDKAGNPNLLISHDRFSLGEDFFRGFQRYGYDFDFVTMKQYDLYDWEHPSYATLRKQMVCTCGNSVKCDDYSILHKGQYVNGGIMVFKTPTARQLKFNTNLFWEQMEDVELSKVYMEHSIVPRMNFLSSVKVLNARSGYLNSWDPESVLKKVTSESTDQDSESRTREMVLSHMPKEKDQIYYGITDNRYIFPYYLCRNGEKIVIYGAGDVGQCFARQARRYSFVQIVGIVDKRWKDLRIKDLEISSPKRLPDMKFDAVIIAVKDGTIAEGIRRELESLGISPMKIRWDGGSYDRDLFYKEHYFKLLDGGKKIKKETKCRLFIETTHINACDLGTGIQRVVNQYYRYLVQKKEYAVIPVSSRNGELHFSKGFHERNFGKRAIEDELFELEYGDVLFLPDISWANIEETVRLFQWAKEKQVRTYVLLYDIIPIRNQGVTKDSFVDWIHLILEQAHGLIGISRFVVDDISSYYKENFIRRTSPLSCYYIYPGYDFPKVSDGQIRNKLKTFLQNKKVFLMIGTIGERKQQRMVAEKFIDMWRREKIQDTVLLLMGHVLNKPDATPFLNLIENNKEFADRILWIKDATDSEVEWAYQNASALIQASTAEGYGLPPVEASSYHLPVICSEIPVFREVMGDYAVYYPAGDMESLREIIEGWPTTASSHSSIDVVKKNTWENAVNELLDIISEKKNVYKVLY